MSKIDNFNIKNALI